MRGIQGASFSPALALGSDFLLTLRQWLVFLKIHEKHGVSSTAAKDDARTTRILRFRLKAEQDAGLAKRSTEGNFSWNALNERALKVHQRHVDPVRMRPTVLPAQWNDWYYDEYSVSIG